MNNSIKKSNNCMEIPNYGWKVSFDHKFPEKRNQNIIPRIRQLPQLLPLFFRYLLWYLKIKYKGKKPFIDCVTMIHGKQIYGVPLGGIGSGTIGRGFRGEFCRYQMRPGIYEYNTIDANQFIVNISDEDGKMLYQKVLSPHRHKKKLRSWDWGLDASCGSYCALYPRSWTVYDLKSQSIRLVCTQISPVIPHDYKDSCLPVGVFVWRIENKNESIRRVSITFTFKNGTGGKFDKDGGCWSESFESEKNEATAATGVVLHQTLDKMKLRYCVAVDTNNEVEGSFCERFNPRGSGEEVWNSLLSDGTLSSSKESLPPTRRGEELAVAVSGRRSVRGGGAATVAMALSWDAPNIQFGGKMSTHTRRYTQWFSDTENAARDIACYALQSYPDWQEKIDNWQQPILKNPGLPDWFKSALFNELYFISDGGSVWLEMPHSDNHSKDDPRYKYGRFGYLESHEYRMYNTYDVHFYASWALVALWPHLQRSLQWDIGDASALSQMKERTHLFRGDLAPAKVAGAVPHDLGDPEADPFDVVNAYLIHDVNNWKDLNLKFVLQVYRDWRLLGYDSDLERLYPICVKALERSFLTDTDGDGLPDSDGEADQTYDSWLMHGPSAYVSSLYVSALAAAKSLAKHVQDEENEKKYSQALDIAVKAMYDRLWNGEYFNFDICNNKHGRSLMADQLVGQWYLTLSGHGEEILRPNTAESILKALFERNVMGFCNGTMGAVNGTTEGGHIDKYTLQSEEVWTGVSYGLASTMIAKGLENEGWRTAEGIYRTVYERIGLGFETPEAIYEKNKYRAVGYMRPLAIWSVLEAFQQRENEKQRMMNGK